MNGLDTNVLVRYLVQNDPVQSEQAAQLLERAAAAGDKLFLSRIESAIVATFRPFDPEKIVLFGSFARGDWGEGSDIDVFVVYQTTKRFLDRLEELYLAWEIPIGVDILAYTPEEFARMLKESAFVQDAVAEGLVLYERH